MNENPMRSAAGAGFARNTLNRCAISGLPGTGPPQRGGRSGDTEGVAAKYTSLLTFLISRFRLFPVLLRFPFFPGFARTCPSELTITARIRCFTIVSDSHGGITTNLRCTRAI